MSGTPQGQLGELIPGEMLVPSAGQQDDGLLKGPQGGAGSLRAGGDGIVVIAHAVQLTHRLQPMGHALESANRLTHGLARCASGRRDGAGGQDIGHVVAAPQLYLLHRTHTLLASIQPQGDPSIPEEGASLHWSVHAEQPEAAPHWALGDRPKLT